MVSGCGSRGPAGLDPAKVADDGGDVVQRESANGGHGLEGPVSRRGAGEDRAADARIGEDLRQVSGVEQGRAALKPGAHISVTPRAERGEALGAFGQLRGHRTRIEPGRRGRDGWTLARAG